MGKKTSIVILGPTASGKTKLAVQLANDLEGEIISADSRQVYTGLDIGTGKDLDDYIINGKTIPYHLIDIRPVGYKYNVSEFQEDAKEAILNIEKRGLQSIICGGTGFYIEAILKGFPLANIPINDSLREELSALSKAELIQRYEANRYQYKAIDFNSKKRIIRGFEIAEYLEVHQAPPDPSPLSATIIGIDVDRDLRRTRITERLKRRFEEGMTHEVEHLLSNGVQPKALIYYGLEYKLITEHLIHKTSHQDLFKKLETAIHQYARRQMTYFRKLERDGHNIQWIDGAQKTKEQLKAALDIIKPS